MLKHKPRKRFGQNFLESEAVIQRLVGSIGPKADDHLVEIGPGLGALTEPLLRALNQLDVVELDRDLADSLAQRLGRPANLNIHQADALKFDFKALANERGQGSTLRIVGNLPYNISTPLLFHLLDQSASVQDMHFMLQKEVVDRLTAEPGSKSYGRLTVMAQYRAECMALFIVPPSAFRPSPKVDSAIIRIVPKQLTESELAILPTLQDVVRKAFSQRRKTLRNTLKGMFSPDQFEQLSIDPGRRAETLSIEEFKSMALALMQRHAFGGSA